MTARHSKGPRLFLSDVRFLFTPNIQQHLELPREESHYVRDVLRLVVGDSLEIGSLAEKQIVAATIRSLGEAVTVTLHDLIQSEHSPQRPIILLCALCKGDKNEQIIDWATELGCSAFHFWQATRSVVRLRNKEEFAKKAARFQKVALAAAQQSKQSSPPSVSVHPDLLSAVQVLSSETASARLVCSLRPSAPLLHTSIPQLSADHPIVVAVGPEGDFTPEELAQLTSQASFAEVSLGQSVLRSELAVVTALVAIRHEELVRGFNNANKV
jgi:16S rRNA (uracil1498-N3)-methyltransferase